MRAEYRACCSNHGNRSKWGRPGTSSEAGQIGRSATLPHTALQRQGAGQRMLALLSGPSLLAVTPATITLSMTCQEEDKKKKKREKVEEGSREVKQGGGFV